MKKTILVTGGAGFIGSNLVKFFVKKYKESLIINIDSLSYASNYEFIEELISEKNYLFFNYDINDREKVNEIFENYDIDLVVHLAAESHVDNSIEEPLIFAHTNIIGTLNLLSSANYFWKNSKDKLFYHISTDEVYGSLGKDGFFTENTPYNPRSPYSASKASADHFVRAFYHTHNLPIIISNCSNNFGPNQHIEKLIPKVIYSIVNRKNIPVYGDGSNIRDWLFVEDHVMAINSIINFGKIGETYNIGGNCEISNIQLVKKIIIIADEILGNKIGFSKELISFVNDRKGHDYRYAVNFSKLNSETNWTPKFSFEDSLRITIDWYINLFIKL